MGYTADDGGSFSGLKLYSMIEVYVLQGKSSKVSQNEGWKNQGVFVIIFLPWLRSDVYHIFPRGLYIVDRPTLAVGLHRR